jgi:hypothetical protein
MSDKPAAPVGAPSIFSQELADEICRQMATGRSLRSVCREKGMPDLSTVIRWLAKEGPKWDEFRTQYTRAREAMADAMAEELLEISDDGSNDWMDRQRQDGSTERVLDHEHVQRSKLRVDTRKWLASKVAPKKYGERITQEHTGDGLTALADALESGRKRCATQS